MDSFSIPSLYPPCYPLNADFVLQRAGPVAFEMRKISVTCILTRMVSIKGRRDGVVGVANGLQHGRSGVPFQAEATDFLISTTVQTCSGAHPASYSMAIGVISPEGTAAGS